MEEWTGLFITLPAELARDNTMPDGAKLMYAFIASLSHLTGYCYATNAYLAEAANVSQRSAENHVRSLKNAGYIDVEIIRDERGEVKERRIRCMVNFKGQPMEYKGSRPDKRKAYGSQKNVLLTDKQYSDLKILYPTIDEEIENMSLYCAANGKPYKNCYAALLNWMRRRAKEEKPKGSKWDGVDY